MHRYLDVFEDAWGARPGNLVKAGFRVSPADVRRLTEAWALGLDLPAQQEVGRQLTPLVSHHDGRDSHLFGVRGPAGTVSARALTYLFAFDGLVVADPLVDIAALVDTGRVEQACSAAQTVLVEVAELAPLIDAGAIRVSNLRPTLSHPARSTVLAAFGLGPDMAAFGNFAQAYDDAVRHPTLEREYLSEAADLLTRFDLPPDVGDSAADAWRAVRDLAAGILEVSWQLAVASMDPRADIALRSGVEEHLFGKLLEDAPGDEWRSAQTSASRGRHFGRMVVGDFPFGDLGDLAVSEALSVRSDDSFERFRAVLHTALSDYETAILAGKDDLQARRDFSDRMAAAAAALRDGSSIGRGRRLLGPAIPIALTAAATLSTQSVGVTTRAAVGVGSSAAGLIGQWALGRRQSSREKIVTRYCAILGRAR